MLFDIGGIFYPDDVFYAAVTAALSELLQEQGREPLDPVRVRHIYDQQRKRQSGSLRRRLAEEILGSDDWRDELNRRTAVYWKYPAGSLYDDVLPCLASIRGHASIGVVANQQASVVDALRRDGVADYIDIWAVSALVGHEKPDVELFRWALERAGCDPHEAMHVGNRLDTDVRPAAAIGLRTAWLLRGEAPDEPSEEQLSEPDFVLHDLGELHPIIRAAARGSQ